MRAVVPESIIAGVALAAVVCCTTAAVQAHAPLPRALAIAPGGGVAVRMPGFGWLVGDGEAFAYACDALLGVSPLEEHAPMAYRSDGALLVGTAHGVRWLDATGCPSSTVALDGTPIVALAVRGQRVVALGQAADSPPFVHVSDDDGETFQLGAELALEPLTSLVLDASDADTVYVSRATAIDVSIDAGVTFRSVEQTRALTLLHADAEAQRFWASARVPNANVGVVILRADAIEGPWSEVLTVNFFGGLAVDPEDPDRVFVGDEARGVFRTTDGGATFEETAPEINSAALDYAAGALWSCTPGSPHATALVRSEEHGAAFQPIIAFSDVAQLVQCPDVDVEQTCGAAWLEWQRDVLAAPLPPSLADAGAPDASIQDAALEPAPDAATPGASSGSSSCSAIRPTAPSSDAFWFLLALSWLARRARRRQSAP
jgi:hypothetical protein